MACPHCGLERPRTGNDRLTGCVRCGRQLPQEAPQDAVVRPRDLALERDLTDVAARAAGLSDDLGLRAYADYRAHPGGVRAGADWDQEAREEIADCSSYLVWGCIEVYAGYLAGEPVATALFERRMRALRRTVEAWHDLHTDSR